MTIRTIPRGWLYTLIRLLSISALLFASALAVDYYFNANTFCAQGASCDAVAHSEFGQKYGKFLPVLGLVAYSFFFLTSFFFARTKLRVFGKKLSTFWLPLAIIACALGAILFIVVQAIEIKAFCWLCMGIDTSAIIMIIPAILLMINKDEAEQKQDEEAPAPKYATLLHPLIWIGFYILAAAGPMTWGAFQPPAQSAEVPDYSRSFYKEGKINIVEISSFDCPHCRQLHPQLSELLKEYASVINFTRLTIPLGQKKDACIAYLCAEKQKQSETYADCLFKEPSKDSQKLLEYARECSIDESSFKACLADPATAKAVDDMLQNIRDTGFKGAPTIWIENTPIIGFNAQKGMQPYRDAIERREASLTSNLPIAFICTLILAALSILAGIILRKVKKS